MFNTRMYALAAALLLGSGWYATGQGAGESDVVETGAEVVAYVQDLELVDAPDRYEYPAWNLTSEQLVEGHTTFAVIERTPTKIEENGTVDITGFIECWHHVNATDESWFGLVRIPNRINKAEAGCRVGETIIVTPSLFRPASPQSSSAGPMMPTGNFVTLDTPTGEPAQAEEFVFSATHLTEDGTWVAQDYYAWQVPILQEWMDADGDPRNFWMELPTHRLVEMGVTDFELIAGPRL